MRNKVAIILGTRPEIIKMSPVIRECKKEKLNYFVIHTNQHYSENLDKVFFKELGLPKAKYNLKIGSGSHGEQTGKMLIEIEKVLEKEKPDIVLVEGDTNTVLAGALTASKMHIKVGHIEAGLRSYFREMPEEINRILTDHCSDFLFAPTKESAKILRKEGVFDKKIFITGNTIVDAVFQNLKIAEKESKIIKNLKLEDKEYFLLTSHRAENVDKKSKLEEIIKGTKMISEKFSVPIIYPIHPRTKKMLKKFNLKFSDNVKLIEPLGYLDFLKLESNAKLILTDSGGIQEEACILKVPCVTLRENTERPETVKVGGNILAGTNSEKILKSSLEMLMRKKKWENPFGKGDSSQRIINILIKNEK
jgi:UDP-N-acetylglucosamine 2-epimerase (non-hydrolysing)